MCKLEQAQERSRYGDTGTREDTKVGDSGCEEDTVLEYGEDGLADSDHESIKEFLSKDKEYSSSMTDKMATALVGGVNLIT
ncbi:hypothetical protein JZ751_009531 [Albula glossodonta]|uniref:Uncharacterized protein n=1 Tax=Albula glossodonta TaxID=121402 RepID=A0A8T2P0U5_9TELE|nr:hypothetical protein JZ751_009531 [Albula glossodonta]